MRAATEADAAVCRDIYAPYVTDTAVTFEVEVPTVAEMTARITAAQVRYAWLVLEEADQVAGYAYGGPYRSRAAYLWSCETSIYLRAGRPRTGAGRVLYQALLDRLTERGFVTAVAGMTLPNEASVGLHRALGFLDIGTFVRVGHKLGTWHDVGWMQRDLADPATVDPASVPGRPD